MHTAKLDRWQKEAGFSTRPSHLKVELGSPRSWSAMQTSHKLTEVGSSTSELYCARLVALWNECHDQVFMKLCLSFTEWAIRHDLWRSVVLTRSTFEIDRSRVVFKGEKDQNGMNPEGTIG